MTARIAAFAAATDGDGVTAAAQHVGRLSLLDWVAVGLAGREEPVARLARAHALEDGGAAQATPFGGAARVPARAAALANGAASHALDYDDTHFLHIGHPSVAVAPAALAVAERAGASGGAFLTAYLLGFEASCRIGHWLGRGHYEAGFHQTGTAGTFGATVAAGRLIGLDEAGMAHALGLAATRAAGLKSQFATMGKPLNAGFAAANGVECAGLAALGAVSRPDGLECAQGFAATHAGPGVAAEEALAGLGRDWVLTSVSHKFHACCHGIHAALEALAALRAGGLAAGEVAAVRLTVNPRWLAVCDLHRPETGLEAKFSYRMTAAMALAGLDTAAPESYSAATCAREDLIALRDRVEVATDGALADTEARAEVTTREGRHLAARHDLTALTDPAERERRVRAKAATLLGAEQADAVWKAASQLDGRPVAPLAALLAG